MILGWVGTMVVGRASSGYVLRLNPLLSADARGTSELEQPWGKVVADQRCTWTSGGARIHAAVGHW